MKKLIIALLLFVPVIIWSQKELMTQKDSIEFIFNLRDSIRVQSDVLRSAKNFNQRNVDIYIEYWTFLNYKLLCWKVGKAFSYEDFMMHKALKLYKYGFISTIPEVIKIDRW